MAKEGHRLKGMVNNSPSLLPNVFLDKTTKDLSDGSHIVMEYLKDGIHLYDVGFKNHLKRSYIYFY